MPAASMTSLSLDCLHLVNSDSVHIFIFVAIAPATLENPALFFSVTTLPKRFLFPLDPLFVTHRLVSSWLSHNASMLV